MKGCDYEGGKKKGKGKKLSKMTSDHDRCDMACLMVIVMVMMKLTQLLLSDLLLGFLGEILGWTDLWRAPVDVDDIGYDHNHASIMLYNFHYRLKIYRES